MHLTVVRSIDKFEPGDVWYRWIRKQDVLQAMIYSKNKGRGGGGGANALSVAFQREPNSYLLNISKVRRKLPKSANWLYRWTRNGSDSILFLLRALRAEAVSHWWTLNRSKCFKATFRKTTANSKRRKITENVSKVETLLET